MAIKYRLQHTNFAGVDIKLEIDFPGYVGAVIDIDAAVSIRSNNPTYPLSPIRSQSLSVSVMANQNLTFFDLFTDKEQTFKVELYINSTLEFVGWIKPDGIYQDYVNKYWQVSFDVVDGLALLKNRAYDLIYLDGVEQTPPPLHMIGRQLLIDVIKSCLYKTKLTHEIWGRCDIVPDEMIQDPSDNPSNKSVFEMVTARAERYYDDNGHKKGQAIDCYKVLESTLRMLGCVIQQHRGRWMIYRPHFEGWVRANPGAYATAVGSVGYALEWFVFDFANKNHIRTESTADVTVDIGSKIDGYTLHHINENQQMRLIGSNAAIQIRYNYGLLGTVNLNPELEWDSGGALKGDWVVAANNDIESKNSGEYRVEYRNQSPGNVPVLNYPDEWQIKTLPVSVQDGDQFSVDVTYYSEGMFTGFHYAVRYETDDGDIFWWYRGFWNAGRPDNPKNNKLRIVNSAGNELTCDHQPGVHTATFLTGAGYVRQAPLTFDFFEGDGHFEVFFFAPVISHWPPELDLCYAPPESFAYLESVKISMSDDQYIDKGEIHTAWFDNWTASEVKDTMDVLNGDMPSDAYEGVIELLDGRNTRHWDRLYSSIPDASLLQLAVVSAVQLTGTTRISFEGDVFGYIRLFSFITINNVPGIFMPYEWSYNAATNVTMLRMIQLNVAQDDPYEYERMIDYTDATRPKIKAI